VEFANLRQTTIGNKALLWEDWDVAKETRNASTPDLCVLPRPLGMLFRVPERLENSNLKIVCDARRGLHLKSQIYLKAPFEGALLWPHFPAVWFAEEKIGSRRGALKENAPGWQWRDLGDSCLSQSPALLGARDAPQCAPSPKVRSRCRYCTARVKTNDSWERDP